MTHIEQFLIVPCSGRIPRSLLVTSVPAHTSAMHAPGESMSLWDKSQTQPYLIPSETYIRVWCWESLLFSRPFMCTSVNAEDASSSRPPPPPVWRRKQMSCGNDCASSAATTCHRVTMDHRCYVRCPSKQWTCGPRNAGCGDGRGEFDECQ